MGPPESRFPSVPNRALSQITPATGCLSITKTERMRFALRQRVSAGSDSHVPSPDKFHKDLMSRRRITWHENVVQGSIERRS
jgi:hypothetical protein